MKKEVYQKIRRGGHELLHFAHHHEGRILFNDLSGADYTKPFISHFLYQNGFKPIYPQGRKFAVCVSHDIDILVQPNFFGWQKIKAPLRELWEGYPLRAANYFSASSQINPYQNLDKILDYEAHQEVVSAFYFLALQPHEEDFSYHVESLQSTFQQIVEKKSEIGLHGGHQAFKSLEKIKEELILLQRNAPVPVVGYRNHFLRFDTTCTWSLLSEANFLYDTTYGLADFPGYRNGMCYPYQAWDHKKNIELPLLEIPLLVMDATFIYYLNWNPTQAVEYVMKMIDEVAACQGVFTILWHNNLFIGEWGKAFKRIITHCRKKEAWFATGKQMAEWWNEKQYTQKCQEIMENVNTD